MHELILGILAIFTVLSLLLINSYDIKLDKVKGEYLLWYTNFKSHRKYIKLKIWKK